jgi:hypothetical protein
MSEGRTSDSPPVLEESPMKTIRSVRALFRHACVFNVVGAALLFAAGAQERISKLIGLKALPTDTWALHLVVMAVLVFGWMYWTIGRDPLSNRGMIPFGIVAKVLTFAVIFGHWLNGDVHWQLAALSSGDAIYAFLFWRARAALIMPRETPAQPAK